MTQKKVLVFGVFDGLHAGHQFFLREAKKFGDYLIVAVTPDEVVRKLKNKSPIDNLSGRIKKLKEFNFVDEIIKGDSEIGSWNIFKSVKPDIIALGYDQEDLENSLKDYFETEKSFHPQIKKIPAFKPETYKSSKIKN
mgnify:CR=1 FL=1